MCTLINWIPNNYASLLLTWFTEIECTQLSTFSLFNIGLTLRSIKSYLIMIFLSRLLVCASFCLVIVGSIGSFKKNNYNIWWPFWSLYKIWHVSWTLNFQFLKMYSIEYIIPTNSYRRFCTRKPKNWKKSCQHFSYGYQR